MNQSSAIAGLINKRIKVYFGFSRMSHSVLDIGHPGFGALLVLGSFPPLHQLVLGLIASFSGYTAVFALNDLMDFRIDTERIEKYQKDLKGFDLDVLGMRHPIAQKVLPFANAFAWVLFWGLLSLVTAFMLSPICFFFLVGSIVLEIGYCMLLRRSHWKALLSGSMVGLGALAGVFAVVRHPSPVFVLLLFFWAFGWEVGGRNITNDWTDLEEDIHLGIRTFPVRYGRRASAVVSTALICATVLVSLVLPFPVGLSNPVVYEAGAIAVGWFLMVGPAWRWAREGSAESAMALFNRACFYPAAMLAVAVLSL